MPNYPVNTAPLPLSGVPIGTILPFVCAINPLPAGWHLCDGSVINDPASPLNGYTLPDLTDSRFLAGVDSNQGALVNTNIGTNSIPSDGGHAHTGTADPNITQLAWSNGQQFQTQGGQTQDHQHPLTISYVGGHNHNGENRPAALFVWFIIRIK